MRKDKVYCALALTLTLLSGCASTIPEEAVPAQADERTTPVFAAREAYQPEEVSTQEAENGSVIDAAGICSVTIKGFGAGKTITADGQTCAGAKNGETLVWVTCDYVNLTQNEVSPGRLIENGTLQLDSGTSDGKSASFSPILPGETAEVYFYYAVPEDLPDQPLTLQFTIGGQAYSYEVPTDRSGALLPTLPKTEEPENVQESDSVTLQHPTEQNAATQTDVTVSKNTSSRREPAGNGGYTIYEYDSAGRVVKGTLYDADGNFLSGYINKFGIDGNVEERDNILSDGSVVSIEYYNQGRKLKYETPSGFTRIYEYDDSGRRTQVTDYNNGEYLRTWVYQDGKFLGVRNDDGSITPYEWEP